MGLSEVEFYRTQKHGKICFFDQTGSLYFILVNFQHEDSFAFQKGKKKPEMGNFHVSKLLFLRLQIFFVHLFALRYQIPWLTCLTKSGYMISQVKHIRCHVLSWFAQRSHNENTSIVQFFLFPLPFLRSTEHSSLKPSLSIKQQRRKERLCSLTRKFWCISGCG